ncbi:DUF2200 domain-containing protein [Streptococcus loxodontisalivarius]|uniref:DUF2200 domain-containing protein n=1 Tax=Streptococcus loxodontisalivarius TaxID=1349415 RepID=A0ABS2PT70_9STRE|nr:DUF2200 domain-containing protein [Streptococcus loxodontisalivarius]MBM7642709.1 hypothetical protein [Streptococcus loxodontisalivarius]
MTHRIYGMTFANVYKALLAKAERKGRTAQEVHQLTAWLTGYSPEEIEDYLSSEITYGDFFRKAPALNPNRVNITGKICGVQIETIEDPLMQDIRRLDRLVDWLAKGKSLEAIYDKYQ